jgi:hypothetical protein
VARHRAADAVCTASSWSASQRRSPSGDLPDRARAGLRRPGPTVGVGSAAPHVLPDSRMDTQLGLGGAD